MSVFNLLGEAVGNIPKVVNDAATGVASFVEQNFDIAGTAKKVTEMGARIISGGQTASFNGAAVDAGKIGFDTSMMYGSDRQESMSAALFPNYSNQNNTNNFKVVISQDDDGGGGPFTFVFEVMPRIDESRSVDYEQVTPVHHPGSIQKYRNTSNRSWRIAGRLMSRTAEEASKNMSMLNLVRSWMMPYYGEGTASSSVGSKLGAPPPVLRFKAYGNLMIGPVRCVLKDANWSFDNTLDYITTLEGNPFPVLLEINISLEEAWSPAEYSGFDLQLYKQGILGEQGAFKRTTAIPPAPSAVTAMNEPESANAGAGVTSVGGEPRFGVYVPRDQLGRENASELQRLANRGASSIAQRQQTIIDGAARRGRLLLRSPNGTNGGP